MTCVIIGSFLGNYPPLYAICTPRITLELHFLYTHTEISIIYQHSRPNLLILGLEFKAEHPEKQLISAKEVLSLSQGHRNRIQPLLERRLQFHLCRQGTTRKYKQPAH